MTCYVTLYHDSNHGVTANASLICEITLLHDFFSSFYTVYYSKMSGNEMRIVVTYVKRLVLGCCVAENEVKGTVN